MIIHIYGLHMSCPCFRRSRDRSIVKRSSMLVSIVRPGRLGIIPGAPADRGDQ
jgi:hypothetical protein